MSIDKKVDVDKNIGVKNIFSKEDDVDIENVSKTYKPYFQERYENYIINHLIKKFNIKNIHNVPKLSKIVIAASVSNLKNIGNINEIIYKIYNSLYLVTGIKPIYTKAKRSISQFKIYKGVITGAKVNLTRKYMYEFMERFCHAYLSNLRGFYGVSFNSISKNTVNIGINDAHIMKEIVSYLGVTNFSFNVSIIIDRSDNKEYIYELLRNFDLPIRKDL